MPFKKAYPLLLVVVAGILVRLSPNLIAPVKTFGYDYGFYLFNLNHSQWPGFLQWITSGWSGYGNILFPVVHGLQIPSEQFLFVSQLVAALFGAVACFYFWGKENRTSGVASGLLFIFSIAQTQMHQLFLWKNLVAMVFVILALKFLKEQKYWWVAGMSLITLLTHRTSAIVLLTILAIYSVYELIIRKSYKALSVVLAALGAVVLFSWPFLQHQIGLFNLGNIDVVEGIFLTKPEYLIYSWPLIVIGIVGAYLYSTKKEVPSLYILLGLTLVWILFRFPFHNRVLPYFDLGLILFGGDLLSRFADTSNKKVLAGAALAFMLFENIFFTRAQTPLITSEEIAEIQHVNISNPETVVIALSANDAPWLLGYLPNLRIAAPGLFENRHTVKEWAEFWDGKEQKIFFTRYPRPLVLYTRSQGPVDEVKQCAPELSANFRNFECL